MKSFAARLVSVGVMLLLLCVAVVPFSAVAADYQAEFTLRFEDENGQQITDVDCSAYAYDDDGNIVTLDSVRIDKDGTVVFTVNFDSVSERKNNSYVHLTVKAFADGKEPISFHWSVDPIIRYKKQLHWESQLSLPWRIATLRPWINPKNLHHTLPRAFSGREWHVQIGKMVM